MFFRVCASTRARASVGTMLNDVELPAPWKYVEGPIPNDRALEDALALSVPFERLNSDEVEKIGAGVFQPSSIRARRSMVHSWERIRDEVSEREVLLRLQRDEAGVVRVSSVVFLPHGDEWSVSGIGMRSLPIAAIEEAVNDREFYSAQSIRIMFSDPKFEALAPLGSPRGDEHFYEKVALQFLAFKENFPNPTGEIVKLNDVAVTTAQTWVTESRKRGFLPPGRPGRAG